MADHNHRNMQIRSVEVLVRISLSQFAAPEPPHFHSRQGKETDSRLLIRLSQRSISVFRSHKMSRGKILGPALPRSRRASMRSIPPHFGRQLILALAQVDDMPQQTIRRPFDVADLDDHFGRTQWTRDSTSGDPHRVPRGGG